jgi:hypothetical protein
MATKRRKRHKKKDLSLTEYLRSNEKLITIVGVFGALAAYFSTLQPVSIPLTAGLGPFPQYDVTYFAAGAAYLLFLCVCCVLFNQLIVGIRDKGGIKISLAIFELFFLYFIGLLTIFMYAKFTDFVKFIIGVVVITFSIVGYVLWFSDIRKCISKKPKHEVRGKGR